MLAMLYCFLFYNIHHTFLNKKKIEYEKSNKRGVSKVCYMTNSIIELYPAATDRMRPLNPSPLLTCLSIKAYRPFEITTPLGSNCLP